MKKSLLNFILLLISCSVSLVLGEVGIRAYLYIKDSNRSFDLVITTYQKKPGSKGIRYEFDPENNLEFKANVRYNNWGYRSDLDWQDQKEPGEFRIAVFGDSYTECETSDFSWVDVINKKLSVNAELLKQLNSKKITVANFGASGVGFQWFGEEYLSVRERFKPDLTVFAFIDEDFERLTHQLGDIRRKKPKSEHKIRTDNEVTDIRSYLQIPGFGGHLFAIPTGPNIFVRSLYYNGTDDKLILDKDRLQNAKRFLATTVAKEKYLKSINCELCKLINSTLLSRFPSLLISSGSDDASDGFLQAAYESIDIVGPEPLILVNLPTFYETVNQWNKNGPLRAAKYFPKAALQRSSLQIIPMADFLPKSASYEEKYSWFTLPWDGHPSNHGADVFGATISKLLKDYLTYSFSGKGQPYMFLTAAKAKELILVADATKEREAKEVKAYQILEIARKKRDEQNYEESLDLFSKVLQLAPQIGMPGLLYVERGDIYQILARSSEALDDYTRAIAINPHQSFLIRHAMVAYGLGKMDLLALDVKQLEACCKDEIEVKQLMAQLASASGD